VGAADPRQASSQHSNVTLRVNRAALASLLASEVGIARFSGWKGSLPALSGTPLERASA
jgi:hypothetical protein